MQKYKEINGNDYVKNSRTTINETMQSIQSMNSGTAFPTTNLFEGMKCYRTDLKKTYTLTDVENNTWVEDAHATLSDEATHAASATKLDTARSLNLGGAVTADAATFDGTANATINVKTLDATKLKGTASVSTTGNAATATKVVTTATDGASANIAEATMAGSDGARIRVSGADNLGELALETKDDGDNTIGESIVARKYSGNYTTVTDEAYLLDKNGNTTFPKNVISPKFTGSLVGNADSAKTLSSATPTLAVATEQNAIKINDKEPNKPGNNPDGILTKTIDFQWYEDHWKIGNIRSGGPASKGFGFKLNDDMQVWIDTKGNINATSFTGSLVGNAATASKATADANGNELANAQRYMHVYDLPNNTDFNNVKTTGIYTCTQDSYTNRPANSWGVLRVYWFNNNVKQEYVPDNRYEVYERYFTGGEWNAWSKVNAANADRATKLATPRTISLTGNASGSANFDGSGNVSINTTVNESKHAAAATALDIYAYRPADANIQKGDGLVRYFLATSSMKSNGPMKDAQILHLAWDNNDGFDSQLAITNVDGDIQTRSQNGGTWGNWKTFLNEKNYTDYAPTKTGGGASGTWGINISGNAATATTATKANTASSVAWSGVTGKPGTYPPSAHNHDSAYPSVTGTRASGTWGINISGNAASATNADKVDGYHASDLIRILGGNRTPVIMDIFDRAGTIDMSTMSAADKATHKANINKASNMTQNIWNNDTGIHAYSGDYNMSNGYSYGALKLTQSYKNFEKILIVGCNDDGNIVIPYLWDVWELAYMFANSYRFYLFSSDYAYWVPYGTTKHGNATRVWSTDTIWNCETQNSGIIAIYGIKF